MSRIYKNWPVYNLLDSIYARDKAGPSALDATYARDKAGPSALDATYARDAKKDDKIERIEDES